MLENDPTVMFDRLRDNVQVMIAKRHVWAELGCDDALEATVQARADLLHLLDPQEQLDCEDALDLERRALDGGLDPEALGPMISATMDNSRRANADLCGQFADVLRGVLDHDRVILAAMQRRPRRLAAGEAGSLRRTRAGTSQTRRLALSRQWASAPLRASRALDDAQSFYDTQIRARGTTPGAARDAFDPYPLRPLCQKKDLEAVARGEKKILRELRSIWDSGGDALTAFVRDTALDEVRQKRDVELCATVVRLERQRLREERPGPFGSTLPVRTLNFQDDLGGAEGSVRDVRAGWARPVRGPEHGARRDNKDEQWTLAAPVGFVRSLADGWLISANDPRWLCEVLNEARDVAPERRCGVVRRLDVGDRVRGALLARIVTDVYDGAEPWLATLDTLLQVLVRAPRWIRPSAMDAFQDARALVASIDASAFFPGPAVGARLALLAGEHMERLTPGNAGGHGVRTISAVLKRLERRPRADATDAPKLGCDRQAKIIAAVVAHPGLSAGDLAKVVRLREQDVRRILRGLVQDGILRNEGSKARPKLRAANPSRAREDSVALN